MSDKINTDEWETIGILHVLDNSTEPVTTSQIKKELGLDSTKTVTYRWDKMEQAGLITTSQLNNDEWDKPGIPPRTAELTPDGDEFVNAIDLEGWDEPDTIPRRIEQLERQVDRQEQLIDHLMVATGVNQDSLLPPVHHIRAGFTAVDDAIGEVSNGDIDVSDFVAKWASDEVREIDEQLD